MDQTRIHFERLVTTIKTLRSEAGCPWDKKQTTASLKKYLVEEFEEILLAIENHDPDNLCEELGDFLYLIIMLSEIHDESGQFALEDVIRNVDAKLIRRHPHVFGGKPISDSKTLRNQWRKIKEAEKAAKKNS